METRKLYYEDCHLSKFTAQVTGCEEDSIVTSTGVTAPCWQITLDATAFYPEGGGQACDIGMLNGVHVWDVQERGGTVVHFCDGPLEVGTWVEGRLDQERRFYLMQQHSGEHIVSGIIHDRYGHHNVCFHMGSEVITSDFDGPIPPAVLPAFYAAAH